MSVEYTGLVLGGPSAGQIISSQHSVLTVAVMPTGLYPTYGPVDGNYGVRGEYGSFTYIFASFTSRGFWVPSDVLEDRVPWIVDQLMAHYRPKFKTGFK